MLVQVKEDTVRLLLPYVLAGLGRKASADYHTATLMIVTLLASKATLSEGLLTGMTMSRCGCVLRLAELQC